MSEIRGEKVGFRKKDIVALHALPSAQAHDPIIVHAPRKNGILRFCAKVAMGLFLCAFVIGASLVAVIESGMMDSTLNARARTALNAALGDAYRAEVGSTVIRMTSNGALALKAREVALSEATSGQPVARLRSISIALDPVALMTGRIAVSSLEADGGEFDTGLLPRGEPLDLTKVRIADVGEALEAIFAHVDRMSQMAAGRGSQTVTLSDFNFSVVGARKRVVPIVASELEFNRESDGSMSVKGNVTIDGVEVELSAGALGQSGHVTGFEAAITNLPLAPFFYHGKSGAEQAFGIDATAGLTLKATRAVGNAKPDLRVSVRTSKGAFHAGGLVSTVNPSQVDIAYDFERSAIEILPSVVKMGRSNFPFTGAIIDLDKMAGTTEKGFAIDLLLKNASSAPEDIAEQPLVFDAKATGRFTSDTHRLIFDELAVSSPLGSMFGSLSVAFGETSPQISFASVSDRLEATAVKQLWPWWIAKGARRWAIGNLFGGTVTNARIEVSLAAGRIANTEGELKLNEQELNINFDIDDTRINITGEIPPLRDTSGQFKLSGQRMTVQVGQGTAFFPSGRSVALNGGDFILPDVYTKPLMAEMKIEVGGNADAIAELVSYKPIQALQKTPLLPEDFSGPLTALVGARFGLISDQHPPKPLWQVEMQLEKVTVNNAMFGRAVSDLAGTFRVDNQQAVLDADARIEGAKVKIALTEPVDASSTVKRSREISGTLDEGVWQKLIPGLSRIVSGPITVDVAIDEANRQKAKVGLTKAALSLPWIGWSKGVGIPAEVQFTSSIEGEIATISDFAIAGDGFGARGSLKVDDGGLLSADLDSVRLAQGDDFKVDVDRAKGGYTATLSGAAADIRPILAQLKSGSDQNQSGGDDVTIKAQLDRVTGFNGETLSNVNLVYAERGRQIEDVNLSAVTDSGQALVARLAKAGADNTLEVTTGDAGSLARFADIYQNMRGGLLNLKLRDRGGRSWRGTVDIRKFQLVGEQRLQSMVSTPTGADGRSLNQAVRRDIDVSSARFERGFAQLALDRGAIRIDGGVLRGTDVGATFQGTVRDNNGNMDMTGTFMPAYGLNRLFGELPLIGVLLGNGRDRGLLGITFKLNGPFNQPKLTINPLSIIAPGVFRSIFEFQ
ncbi:YhdP family protein [Ensifer sp. MJa1]|uniref:YhdP family protein n=1 Tax=Ensifer sp. MJa1 TaxID=2919888 RepID=UPI00300A7E8B